MQGTPTESLPGALPGIWRERAEFLKEYGHRKSARLWECAARELDGALRVLGQASLSLVQAARECGYSPDHLGALIRNGKIPNVGRRNAPRIRRADLPLKAFPPVSLERQTSHERQRAEEAAKVARFDAEALRSTQRTLFC